VSDRDFDVVVLGATGVTGRQVAAYLAGRSRATGARWAAAARDKAKLERVLDEVGVIAPESVAVDVSDPQSLHSIASRARVVLNAVGPYTLHGRPVIEACVGAGTHYADLTGEIPFVREMIKAVGDRAGRSGAKIVQVCGFESLPADLAVLLATQSALERYNAGPVDVQLQATLTRPPGLPRPSDGMSGGTSQSAAATLSHQDASSQTDPAALVFDDEAAEHIRRLSPISVRPRHVGDGRVLAPMLPAAFINPAVIHRTGWLLDAEPFRYEEGIVLTGPPATFPLRYAVAGAISGFQVGLARLTRASQSVRDRAAAGLSRVLPSSGYGPDASRLGDWRWQMVVDARTGDGRSVVVDVDGEGHPGYLATAKMFGEAGLLLAEPGATPERAGCLTPALALGTDHIDRFAHAGLRFRVRDDG
jgi:short subunit dehydrogenase-like uncharacterized protein